MTLPRLLALCEYAQEQAIGKVNAGVTRIFYNSFSSRPSSVFGKVIGGFRKAHLPAITDEGTRQFIEREAKQIFGMMDTQIPALFKMVEQAQFAIGYYHQRTELPDTPPRFKLSTERGDVVRSQSEVIIANMLHARSINYIYEEPFPVPGQRPMRPDFTILGDMPRDTVYIEHLGLMDDEKYQARWKEKLAKYQNNGVEPWDHHGGGPNGKLVTFQETRDKGLDTEEIKTVLDQLFSEHGQETK